MEPLAERLRPKSLEEYVGQKHIVGPGAPLRGMIEHGHISSFILWGPPGTGKTTLANIIASKLDLPFFTLSAISAGVKDVRDILDNARRSHFFMFVFFLVFFVCLTVVTFPTIPYTSLDCRHYSPLSPESITCYPFGCQWGK